MINDKDPSGDQTDARVVTARVLGNGQPIPGIISIGVTSTGHYQADQANCTFALNAPDAGGIDFWGSQDTLVLDLQVGIFPSLSPPGAYPVWQSLSVCEVDHIQIDPLHGTVTVQGRDLSARFVDTKIQKAYKNLTSSEVAAQLAANHPEITKTVITPTATLVDRYYKDDHDKITLDQFSRTTTEWDLLTYLAQREGFDCFVSGTTFYFQPVTAPSDDPYVVQFFKDGPNVSASNVIDLRLERSLTLAKDVEVTVRSWSSRSSIGFSKTVRATGAKKSSAANSNTQQYVFVRPNLTQDQALQFANAMLVDITKHERVVTFSLPGDTILSPRTLLQLVGTGSSWDQNYYIDSVERSLSFEGGFTMSVRAKNSSPLTQTVVS